MVTMEDWKGSFTDCAKPGDEISEDIYYQMLNVLPPISLKGGQGYSAGFQMGEPNDHAEDEKGRWRARYLTFVNEGDKFFYKGVNFAGEVNSVVKREMPVVCLEKEQN